MSELRGAVAAAGGGGGGGQKKKKKKKKKKEREREREQGATIDFLETLQESGFKIDNPNVVSACGCGSSFQVAEGAEGEDPGCGSGCGHAH